MKRSPGMGGGPAKKRFDKMSRSPQVQMHQQFHKHHMQQQHQKKQQNMAMAAAMANQQYYGGVGSTHPPPGMMPYNNRPPPMPPASNSYMYNTAMMGGGMQNRMWNYNVSVPPPPIRPPPPIPRQQVKKALPPPPPPTPDGERGNATMTHHNSAKKSQPVNAADAVEEDDSQTVVNRKAKRKPMSSRYGYPKDWVREDALKAIALEEEYSSRTTRAPILLLRFPDPDLNREIISKYSPDIEFVHFQQNSSPRYCFVHLKDGTDVEKTIEAISKIPFGTGFVSAELKRMPLASPPPSNPDEVDPYTLYIGNLPATISSRTVKEHFPGAHRIDIGFAQRLKHTRYAFVRYDSVDEAMEAFRRSVNKLIDSRSLIVRFRRQRSTIASGEPVKGTEATAPAGKPKDEITAPSGSKQPAAAAANVVKQHNSPTGTATENHLSTAFDSPSSIGEPENNDVDSKEHVLQEAEKLRLSMQRQQQLTGATGATRRSTLDELFGELERRDSRLADISHANPPVPQLPANLSIKEEQNKCYDDDDISDNEEPVFNNVLGARYGVAETEIKKEPLDEELSNEQNQSEEVFREDFEYDEEFDNEPEEDDDENWQGPTSWMNAVQKFSNLEAFRQKELSTTEKKPTTEQLHTTPTGSVNSGSNAPPKFNEHSVFMKKLHEQVRREKASESQKRPRDDMDDMFAQMNSDTEDENDLF